MNITLNQINEAYNTFNTKYMLDSRNKLIDRSNIDSALLTLESNEKIPLTEDYLKSKLGRKYKCCLVRMMPVVYKLYTQFPKYLPVQIATTSSSLQSIQINSSLLININQSFNHYFNNQSNLLYFTIVNTFAKDSMITFNNNWMDISRIINDLKSIGALVEVDSFYVFNHSYDKDIDCAKSYVISGNILHSLLNNLYSIKSIQSSYLSNQSNDYLYFTIGNTFENKNNEEPEPELKLSKRDRKIYDKYAAIINKCIANQKGLPQSATYRLEENASRPYAPICSEWKSLEKYCLINHLTEEEARALPENTGIEWREDYMDRYFGKGNWIEWDRNASIYNTTLYYNKKEYRNNGEIDMYQQFIGRPFSSKEERRQFKLLNMSLYFGDLRKLLKFYKSAKRAVNLQALVEKNYPISNKDKHCIASFMKNRERFITLLTFANIIDNPNKDCWEVIADWYDRTRANMFNYIGKPHKKTIFMIEGAINLTMTEKIREAGYNCIEVYDGFYTNCKDTELLENLYKEAIKVAERR